MDSILKKEHLKVLKVAKTFYSEETGFIHVSYKDRPFKRGDSIPFYHNFLYALALLQNKERETMEEAIRLVDHLLCFQITSLEMRGAFPRYLHEYPEVQRKFEVLDILLPLYWIYHDFRIIFLEQQRRKLENALFLAGDYLYILFEEKEHSYLANLQIASLLKAMGDLLEKEDWSEKGEIKLKEILSKGPNKSWGSTRHLSKMILYLELLKESESFYTEAFYNYLQHTWHEKMKSFLGPGINEHVYQDIQEPTIYHYYLSKKLNDHPILLLEADYMETVLLRDTQIKKSEVKNTSLTYSLYPFDVVDTHFENYGYSYFNLNKEQWEKRGGFYPFRILIHNNKGTPHSFALHMGSFVHIEKLSENKILFSFENTAENDLDISFYFNLSSEVQVLANGNRASMFNLSIPIILDFNTHILKMTSPNADIERGIWGQLCKGNRRSQIINEFNQTFDWNLYFRKIDNDDAKPFQIEIEILTAS